MSVQKVKPKILVDRLRSIYVHSEGAISRDLEGEFIIVPLFSGMSNVDEDIFSMNEFGKAIWLSFDGKRALQQVINHLCLRYKASPEVIRKDVVGFTQLLLKKKFLVIASH